MTDIKQVFSKKIKQYKSIESYVDEHTTIQGEIFTAIKNKDYPLALHKSLKSMPLGQRIKFVCEIFYTGRYKCYTLGMKRFKREIDIFLETRNKQGIEMFISQLNKEKDQNYNNQIFFDTVRHNILASILDETHCLASTVEHLLVVDEATIDNNRKEADKKYIKVLSEICSILYPNNTAYKVLFL